MATLKYYDTATSEWKTLIVGAKGEQGDPGSQGPSGIVSVSSPITNSGTSTEANIGIDLTNIAPIQSPTFTGTVSGNPAAPANANSAKAIGYVGLPQVQVTSSKTFSATDAGKHQRVDNNTLTLTIPSDSSVPFEIGTTFVVINNGNFSTTIAIDSDDLRLAGTGATGSRTLGNYGMATIVKIKDAVWIISGNGLT